MTKAEKLQEDHLYIRIADLEFELSRSVEKEKVIGIINKRIERLDMRQDTLWELQDLIDKINQL